VVEDTTPKVDSESTILGKQKHSAKAKSVVKKWWKKMSILWELPYWKDNGPPQHRSHAREKECLWEFARTLMNEKWKTKDHAKARADLEELDIRPELRSDGTSAQPPLSTINLTREQK